MGVSTWAEQEMAAVDLGDERLDRRAAAAKQRRCKHTPIEPKESLRWLTGLREAWQAAEQLAQVHCICIADSEADPNGVICVEQGGVSPPAMIWQPFGPGRRG